MATSLIGFPGVPTLTLGLDPVIRVRAESCPLLRDYRTLVDAVTEEQAARTPGWQAVVDHLVQILLFQMLRSFISAIGPARETHPEKKAVFLRAALDDAIGPALGLIHRHPERPWTVTALANHVNISKSAFSERFRQVVGKPPLQYLTEYRIQSWRLSVTA